MYQQLVETFLIYAAGGGALTASLMGAMVCAIAVRGNGRTADPSAVSRARWRTRQGGSRRGSPSTST